MQRLKEIASVATFLHGLSAVEPHFGNPHGLYDPVHGAEHYSTARDLALMAREALTNYPLLREIVRMGRNPDGRPQEVVVDAGARGPVILENRDKILNKPVPGFPDAVVDGVKTGYVAEAGKCLVSSATWHGWQLIAVTLNSTDMYRDNLALLHYGFSRYAWRTYADAQTAGNMAPVLWGSPGRAPLGVQGMLGAPVAKAGGTSSDTVIFTGKRLRAPIRKGQAVGTLSLYRNHRLVASLPAIALASVSVTWWARLLVGIAWLVVFLACFVLLDKFYGTHTKNARRCRRLFTAPGREADHGGTSDR